MKCPIESEIRSFYNGFAEIWPLDDKWHLYSKEEITRFLFKYIEVHDVECILNAGSAGNDYGLPCIFHHVDIADERIKHCERATIASVEQLPFEDEGFFGAICVGSVLNYCDAAQAISELSRVIRKGSQLILEYENSWGFEYLHVKETYKHDATVITLPYRGQEHTQWLYSEGYVDGLLKTYGFKIKHKHRFHILDGIACSNGHDANEAVSLAKWDPLVSKLPFFKRHANNIIVSCEKL